jgi:hypothetical protein
MVKSSNDQMIEMNSNVFKGDFDSTFSSTTLNKLNEYANDYINSKSFNPKPGAALVNVIVTGIKLDWDRGFIELMFDSI